MKESQREAIRKHGIKLLALFPGAITKDPIDLCRRLRRLEGQANALALRLCNGPEFPSLEACDSAFDAVYFKVCAALGKRDEDGTPPIILNRDPRGYALKIPGEWMRDHAGALHADWGGYGILAPEIN